MINTICECISSIRPIRNKWSCRKAEKFNYPFETNESECKFGFARKCNMPRDTTSNIVGCRPGRIFENLLELSRCVKTGKLIQNWILISQFTPPQNIEFTFTSNYIYWSTNMNGLLKKKTVLLAWVELFAQLEVLLLQVVAIRIYKSFGMH